MATVTDAAPDGLVLSPKSARARFPGPELVGSAAAGLRAATAQRFAPAGGLIGDELARGGLGEGPRQFVVVSPGSVRFTRADLNRGQFREERALCRHRKVIDEAVGPILFDPALQVLADAGIGDGPRGQGDDVTRVITSWSRKSRANMVRRIGTLDFTPMIAESPDLAMITLTYPGDWQAVAGTAKACQEHMRALQLRWKRRWGAAPFGVWKREFQRRGAPHFHVLVAPPGGRPGARAFRTWLSSTWADIVAHPDPVNRMLHERSGTRVDWSKGARMLDPKRVGAYFVKHGLLSGKEYQNEAPAEWVASGVGIGRFWGVWRLNPVEVPVMVTPGEMQAGLRTLRRWNDAGSPIGRVPGSVALAHSMQPDQGQASGPSRVSVVWRANTRTGEVRKRKVHRRIKRLRDRAGYLAVNDGPSAAWMLERVFLSGMGRDGALSNRNLHRQGMQDQLVSDCAQ